MINELNPISIWIYNYLTSDSELFALIGKGVDEFQIPEAATSYPRVVFQAIPMNDVRGTAGRRVMVRLQYKIFAVNTGDTFAPLGPITDRLDALLSLDQSTDDPLVIGITRLRPYQNSYTREDLRYNELGGFYYLEGYASS